MIFLVYVLIVVSLSFFARLKGFDALKFVLVRILIKEIFLLFIRRRSVLNSLSFSLACLFLKLYFPFSSI